MAIVAYTGLPGHGKSYGVVENVVLPALADKRTVWTNIPLNLDAIREVYPDADVTVFDVQDMIDRPAWCTDTVPHGCIFVLDEVWRVWPAGMKAHVTPVEYKTFLAEHRHRVNEVGDSTEITLVTQDLSQVSNFARELIESTAIATKLTAVGATKRFRVDMYSGAIKGQRGPKDKLVNSIQGKYKPEVYKFYKSHTMSKSGGAGREVKVDKRATIWNRAGIKYGVPLGLLVGGLAFYQAAGFFSPPKSEAGAAASASASGPAVSQAAPQKRLAKPRLPKVTPWSKHWRFTGVISNGNGGGRALISGDHGRARSIPIRQCHHFHDTGEWYCDVAGARVTSWTGPNPTDDASPSLASIVPTSAS
ncbi:zonular occludens toxin domain-containing protein [Salinisphaera hydrothermalis]|uniref:zonular occludens toxin domain-containing protein n=1 Tax=Salinisphaera hydrothermalis TaxID=563188 RepID=UPI0033418AD9